MNGQPIPGFYWDPEKKKYFRIQKSHNAPRPDLKHTLNNVRKEERKERIQRVETARSKQARKETVVKRHATSLLQVAELQREIGNSRRSYYLQNVWPGACVSGLNAKPRKVVDRSSPAPIRHFDRDPSSKTIYAVHGDTSVKRRRVHIDDNVPPLPPPDPDMDDYYESFPFNRYTFEPWDELARTTSPISSLSYLSASGALAATTIGSDRPPVVYLSDPERDGPYVNQLFTPKNCTAIWDASARPTSFSALPPQNSVTASSTESLVVAASSSLLLFTRDPSGSWDTTTALKLDSDILALDWLSYTTVVLGCRNGKVHIYDTRSKGSSRVLSHPHSISKVRRTDDETRIVCSGLQDTMYLYDFRSSQPSRSSSLFYHDLHRQNEWQSENLFPNKTSRKKRRKVNHAAFKEFSLPVLTFPHSNADDLALDIDVHPRLGLIAAAQDTAISAAAVRVSNMWTGKTVKEFPNIKNSGGGGKEERIRCLRFMDDDDGSSGVNLWTTWNGDVAKFGW